MRLTDLDAFYEKSFYKYVVREFSIKIVMAIEEKYRIEDFDLENGTKIVIVLQVFYQTHAFSMEPL